MDCPPGSDNAVSVQVYLTDMSLFPRMNAVYMTYFKEPRPARTTVGVAKLANAAHMEVTVTAHKQLDFSPGPLRSRLGSAPKRAGVRMEN